MQTKLKSKCNAKALFKSLKPTIAGHFQLGCMELSTGEQQCLTPYGSHLEFSNTVAPFFTLLGP